VVITPTEHGWSLLRCFFIGVIILAGYWMAATWRVLPTSWYSVTNVVARQFFLQFVLLWGGPAFIWWVWRSMVRPQYIRLAPGIIQVMEYPWWGVGNPTIRSYPMTCGTLAVILPMMEGASITLVRGIDCDYLNFHSAKNKDELFSKALFAMMSTAPTPPLSEVELVG
jgi:hypothetical protein